MAEPQLALRRKASGPFACKALLFKALLFLLTGMVTQALPDQALAEAAADSGHSVDIPGHSASLVSAGDSAVPIIGGHPIVSSRGPFPGAPLLLTIPVT